MPKPHYPSVGGPYVAAWNGPQAVHPQQPSSKKAEIVLTESRRQRELQAEVERLRDELEVARQPRRWFASHEGTANQTMVWIALVLCGFGLIFALFAILNHG